MARLQLSLLLALFSICLLSTSGNPKCIFTNNFHNTKSVQLPGIWPALLSNPGAPQLPTAGFLLNPLYYADVPIPASWSGNLWARTRCATDPTTGQFHCETGDCGTGSIGCNGAGGAPPTTLLEITLGSAGGLDNYAVSVVTGYNTPMWVVPSGANGKCSIAGCTTDINAECPTGLRLIDNTGETVACMSACTAFGDPQYCCTGAYSTPATCGPTSYSEFFKSACPSAVTYAFDGGASTCPSPTYTITFCPS
ncbi:thaumatin-like protein 1b [Rhododendron vialii]|uniref:thaumatin-like protein 1b n=1 Tax=Rhododendron vialii TaxID=182163 RepID=UPI00265DA377|nr:thaumatin-like protein 1b [Rhododendron vialii]